MITDVFRVFSVVKSRSVQELFTSRGIMSCDVRYTNNDVRFVVTHICFVAGSYFLYGIFIYLRILVCNTMS